MKGGTGQLAMVGAAAGGAPTGPRPVLQCASVAPYSAEPRWAHPHSSPLSTGVPRGAWAPPIRGERCSELRPPRCVWSERGSLAPSLVLKCGHSDHLSLPYLASSVAVSSIAVTACDMRPPIKDVGDPTPAYFSTVCLFLWPGPVTPGCPFPPGSLTLLVGSYAVPPLSSFHRGEYILGPHNFSSGSARQPGTP